MNLTRRRFLKLAGLAAVSVSVVPDLALAGDEAAPRAKSRKGKVLVVIFLRGGADGLNMVVPFGDPEYAKLRPRIALAAPTDKPDQPAATLDLDGFFGLHPAMRELHEPWTRRLLSVVPAVGSPHNNRSHFTQQDEWETGTLDATTVTADGWLNRHLQTSEGHGVLRAVAVGGLLPRMLRGAAPATAIRSVRDLAYNNRFGDSGKIARDLQRRFADANGGDDASARVESASKTTLEGLKALESIARQPYTPDPAARYPERNGLAQRLAAIAQLIKADVGLEVAVADTGGWDTHQNQGEQGGGAFAGRVGELASAMAAFMRDLGDRADDVMLVTQTEFGRTARENGTAGTDHGHASVALLLGGPLVTSGHGGRIIGRWPGLAREQLNQRRDLDHTVDFRDVLGEIVSEHLGNPALPAILPGHTPRPVGILIPSDEF